MILIVCMYFFIFWPKHFNPFKKLEVVNWEHKKVKWAHHIYRFLFYDLDLLPNLPLNMWSDINPNPEQIQQPKKQGLCTNIIQSG